MARHVIVALVVVLGTLTPGCNKKAPEPAPDTPNVQPAPTPNPDPGPAPPTPGPDTVLPKPKPTPEPVKPEPTIDPTKFVATDLTRYGVRATIDLPEGCELKFGLIAVYLEAGESFKLKVEKADGTLAEWKEMHKKDGDKILEETPNACFVQTGADTVLGYRFRADLTIDEFPASVTGWINFKPKAAAEAHWAAVKTFRRTDAQKAADAPRAEAIKKLLAAKVHVPKAQLGGIEMVLGVQEATAATFALLGEIPDLGEVTIYSCGELPTDVFKPLAKVPGLRKLDLSDRHITNEHLVPLAGHGSLETLKLDRTSVTDGALVHIGAMKNLRTFGASGSPLTDEGLKHLAGLPRLEWVYIYGAQIRGSGLKHLAASKALRSLALNGCSLTDDGLTDVTGPSLQQFDVSNTVIGDAGLAHIARLTKITELNLNNTRVTDAGLKHLAKLADLRDLRLENTTVTGVTLADLLPCKKLSSVWLAGSAAGDAAMAAAVRFPELRTFGVSDTRTTDAALKHLEGWPADRALDLWTRSKHDFSRDAVLALQNSRPKIAISVPKEEPKAAEVKPPIPVAELPKPDPDALFKRFNLEPTRDDAAPGKPVVGVRLGEEKITARDLAELRELKSLKALSISTKGVTDTGLPYLSGLTGLEALSLSGSGVTGDGLVHLKGLVNLRELALESRPYTAAQLAPLAALKNLEKLDLGYGEAGSSRAALSLYKALPNLRELALDDTTNLDLERLGPLPRLERLDLKPVTGSALTERGLAPVAGMPRLKALRIDGAVTDRGLGQLSRLTGLELLHIEHGRAVTNVGMAGVAKITGLNELAIRKSHITDAGLGPLTGLKNLSSLDLAESAVSDAGLASLAELPALRELWLAGTRVTDAGVIALARVPNLALVDLNATRVTAAGVKKLQALKPGLRVRHRSVDD